MNPERIAIECICGETSYIDREELGRKRKLNVYIACSEACRDKVSVGSYWSDKMTLKEFLDLVKPSPNAEFME